MSPATATLLLALIFGITALRCVQSLRQEAESGLLSRGGVVIGASAVTFSALTMAALLVAVSLLTQ